jgi:hypothetical protein
MVKTLLQVKEKLPEKDLQNWEERTKHTHFQYEQQ